MAADQQFYPTMFSSARMMWSVNLLRQLADLHSPSGEEGSAVSRRRICYYQKYQVKGLFPFQHGEGAKAAMRKADCYLVRRRG